MLTSLQLKMNVSLLCKLGLVVFGSLAATACERRPNTGLEQRLAGYDATLQQLPGKFYKPGMGDLMNGLQLRHAKLWYAALAGNWPLADFELHEIRETLDRVAHWHPEEEGVAVGASIDAHLRDATHALDKSIDARDAAAFEGAFDQFTVGCNTCHEATKHGFIVIARPEAEPVSNQRWEGR